jgi:hypothetical protein
VKISVFFFNKKSGIFEKKNHGCQRRFGGSSGVFRAFSTTLNQNRQADEILKANHIVHIAFFLTSLNKLKIQYQNFAPLSTRTLQKYWLERTEGHDSHANPLPQAMKAILETIWLLETCIFARPLVI